MPQLYPDEPETHKHRHVLGSNIPLFEQFKLQSPFK